MSWFSFSLVNIAPHATRLIVNVLKSKMWHLTTLFLNLEHARGKGKGCVKDILTLDHYILPAEKTVYMYFPKTLFFKLRVQMYLYFRGVPWTPTFLKQHIVYIVVLALMLAGTDPGFQVRVCALKIIFGVFRVKNHDFTQKNFFPPSPDPPRLGPFEGCYLLFKK